MRKDILIVAAHPDDEVLGCGATMAALAGEGAEVYTLILGEGATSRGHARKEEEAASLKGDAKKANEILGVRDLFTRDFPDNRFDTVALLDIIKTVEEVFAKVRPGTIFTHHRGDLNIDHRLTCEAALTACRPVEGQTVKEIYSFEVPSSTEWGYPYIFSPNVFVDITGFIDKKIEALRSYGSEMCPFPHPRSERGVRELASCRGSASGLRYAEAFEAVRLVGGGGIL